MAARSDFLESVGAIPSLTLLLLVPNKQGGWRAYTPHLWLTLNCCATIVRSGGGNGAGSDLSK